jgi:hypothetical protein
MHEVSYRETLATGLCLLMSALSMLFMDGLAKAAAAEKKDY